MYVGLLIHTVHSCIGIPRPLFVFLVPIFLLVIMSNVTLLYLYCTVQYNTTTLPTDWKNNGLLYPLLSAFHFLL